MVRRIALVYAVMDECSSVREEHLRAALELWRYAEESARWIFGDRLGDRIADACLALLRDAGQHGATRTEIREALGHRVRADRITDALHLLDDAGLAQCANETTGGRRAERWRAA